MLRSKSSSEDEHKKLMELLLAEHAELRGGIGARIQLAQKTTLHVFVFTGVLLGALATYAKGGGALVGSGIFLTPYALLIPFAFNAAAHAWSVVAVAQYLADNVERTLRELSSVKTVAGDSQVHPFVGFENYLRQQRNKKGFRPIRIADYLDRAAHALTFVLMAGVSSLLACTPRSFALAIDVKPSWVPVVAAVAFILVAGAMVFLLWSGRGLRQSLRDK